MFELLFLVQFVFSCNFGGEYLSICSIEYQSESLKAEEIIDSLVQLNPELKKSTQNKYSYDVSGTGYEHDNLFFWFEKNHYVLSIAHYSLGNTQRLRVVNFGKDGEILEKFDTLDKKGLELANQIIRDVFLPELELWFPNLSFSCNCN